MLYVCLMYSLCGIDNKDGISSEGPNIDEGPFDNNIGSRL